MLSVVLRTQSHDSLAHTYLYIYRMGQSWQLIRTLGKGAFGQVFLALNQDRTMECAVKVLTLMVPLSLHAIPTICSQLFSINLVKCRLVMSDAVPFAPHPPPTLTPAVPLPILCV